MTLYNAKSYHITAVMWLKIESLKDPTAFNRVLPQMVYVFGTQALLNDYFPKYTP